MANVYVQTEECFREQERQTASLFPFIPITRDVRVITSHQLVDVLNSAAEPGPDRNYVLVEEQ